MKNLLEKSLKAIGIFLLRYGLAIVLIWSGLLKFKDAEANYLRDVVANSSLFSWILKYITIYAFAQILAYLQIIAGVLIALKPVAKKLSFWGGIIAVLFMLISVSMLFTSSYVWQSGYGFPELSKFGQSILKDTILLGAAAWCAGDSL
ncbi:DUF417 family protein [Marinilabiliaceae bacterium JC017]|nr:DUF417 family protein [Marinilabiliaceae bacterium JC017]